MTFRELTLTAYGKLHDVIARGRAGEGPHVPFLGFKYESGATDLVYSQLEADFTRELVNEYNLFAYWVDRLSAWEEVLADYSETEADELRFEFTRLPLDHCLHFSYQFRSRLIYCATQLCYTRGISQRSILKGQVRADDEITLGALAAVAKLWRSGPSLIAALNKIDSEHYRERTANYRNRTQHRHGPRLEDGHIARIQRSFPEGSLVAYAMGDEPPLKALAVLPVLVGEAEMARNAFQAYRTLVDEHWRPGAEI